MSNADEQTQLESDPEWLAGLALFNAGHFWHAHEAWETLWLRSAGEQRRFVQAMIQVAAALVHWQRGNQRGLQLNWAKARTKLAPKSWPGATINVSQLIIWMDGMTAATITTAPQMNTPFLF